MPQICIPVPSFVPYQRTEFELRVKDDVVARYRLDCIPISIPEEKKNNKDLRPALLRKAIDGYDNEWELVQIIGSGELTDDIYVLFREKPDKSKV